VLILVVVVVAVAVRHLLVLPLLPVMTQVMALPVVVAVLLLLQARVLWQPAHGAPVAFDVGRCPETYADAAVLVDLGLAVMMGEVVVVVLLLPQFPVTLPAGWVCLFVRLQHWCEGACQMLAGC
jgi:hypothetical protein